jgi:peptidoglycan/xylan/chitin deacetylase (PgdA/CDA1 family)
VRVERYLEPAGLAIFLFHGVVSTPAQWGVRNYTRKHLPLPDFESVIGTLKSEGVPVSMDEVVERTMAGKPLPDRSFAITFDDGFANNLTTAAPVLERHQVPATFYVTTRFIEENRSSWIDRIEHAVERSPACRLDGLGHGFDGVYISPAEKRTLLERIRSVVKSDAHIEPDTLANSIIDQLVADEPDHPELDAKLSWAQVGEMDAHPLFTIGGHSHTHRVLSFLSPADLELEITVSLNLLTTHLGHPVRHYSYPEGLAHCYSPLVIAALQRHGVACAPTAIPGTNAPGDDLFHLRRIPVT